MTFQTIFMFLIILVLVLLFGFVLAKTIYHVERRELLSLHHRHRRRRLRRLKAKK